MSRPWNALLLGIATWLGACTSGEVGAGCGGDEQCRGDEPACLTDVEGGYCTAQCNEDDDCCENDGDCRTDGEVVCSSYESANERYCFVSCAGVGGGGDQSACDDHAPGMECRNTGGGNGRMVCLPPSTGS